MTFPGSETAWHFSSSGTEPDDNQGMDCSSVPPAWFSEDSRTDTTCSTPPFPFAECFVSKSLRLIFALQRETSVRVSEMLQPSSSGNHIPKVFAGGKSFWTFAS